MAAGRERIHENFHSGHTSPFGPRPIIMDAWTLLRERGLNPKLGTQVVILDQSELQQRRQQSPIPTGSPILAELVDLATRNELLAVILDTQNIVLHRGGHHNALAAADQFGFVDGACWDLNHAGVNAAGLAQILGTPITVNR
jgi:transcriptional regulator of acetoin/glycerol metabolism